MVSLLSPRGLSQVWKGVTTEIGKFVDNNTGGAPINRYYNGRTAFEIASMFVGVGAITGSLKAMKAAKLANAIQKVAEVSDRLDVTSKIMSKVGVGFKKIGNKAGKFVIRDAAGGIVGETMEYVNGVYKKVKKKTSAHNQYLGTFEGDVEFADGSKGKGTYELWGKCGSISSLRVNANGCNTVSEMGAEGAKRVTKALKFAGDEATVHFGKHAGEIMKVTGKFEYNLKNYVDDANRIIQNGTVK